MRCSQELMDVLAKLDKKYPDGWNHLPNDHELIVELHAISGAKKKNVKSKRGAYLKYEWTPEREAYLLEHFQGMTYEDLAFHLGTEVSTIKSKVSAFGLKKKKLTMKPVRKVHATTGKVLGRYDSIQQAGEESGIAKASISNCCKQKQGLAGGYRWEFDEEEKEDERITGVGA